MNSEEHAELLGAIRALHREKDAAYRDAWKKRGEVISILANLARKVDRLEYVLGGAPTGGDESTLDTTVDLLVYCLKYETFLADLDMNVARLVFSMDGEICRPCSDGVVGFERLLDSLGPCVFDSAASLDEAAEQVVERFNALETCFKGLDTAHIAVVRLEHVQQLVSATTRLLGTLKEECPASYRTFIGSYRQRGD